MDWLSIIAIGLSLLAIGLHLFREVFPSYLLLDLSKAIGISRQRISKLETASDAFTVAARKIGERQEQFIKLANGSEQKRDERLAAVESQVAGMLVSRVCLQEPTPEQRAELDRVLSEHAFTGKLVVLPEPMFHATAYVDGGHAATDFDLTAPEKAGFEAEDFDGQKTDVKVDVQAVEAWAEAKRGEVA